VSQTLLTGVGVRLSPVNGWGVLCFRQLGSQVQLPLTWLLLVGVWECQDLHARMLQQAFNHQPQTSKTFKEKKVEFLGVINIGFRKL
jgi:hypothetical protein